MSLQRQSVLAILRKEQARFNARSPDVAHQVHLARAQAKRIMAAVYLQKGRTEKARCTFLGAQIKTAADLLAHAREVRVLRKVIVNAGEDLNLRARGELKIWLDEHVREPARAALREKVAETVRRLSTVLEELSPSCDSNCARRGLIHSVRKTRAAYRAARKKKTVKRFHKWRTWAKRLLLQLQLTEPGNGAIKRLDQLQSRLGKAHDLAVAEEFLEQAKSLPKEVRRPLMECVGRARRKCEKKSLQCGRKLFGEQGAANIVAH